MDEADDATLFAGRGKLIVGTKGCSNYFMLGKLDIDEPERLAKELNELRAELLADLRSSECRARMTQKETPPCGGVGPEMLSPGGAIELLRGIYRLFGSRKQLV